MGRIVNQLELAEILGKSTVTIWEWQDQGLPIKKAGAGRDGHKYDTEAVFEWLVSRALARVHKPEAVLKNELLELQVKEARARDGLREQTLVPADQVRPLWNNWVLTAAMYMSNRHSRLAGMLEALPGVEAKREFLRKEDAEFLTKLGVDGKRMQREVDELLERLAAGEAEAFLRRLSGHDDQQRNGDAAAPAG